MKKVMPKFMPMQNVLLTYKDEVVNLADPVSKYKNNATFILHEGEVAEELSNHSGLLWECVDCNLAYTYKSKFKEMEKRGKECGPGHIIMLTISSSFSTKPSFPSLIPGASWKEREQNLGDVQGLQLSQFTREEMLMSKLARQEKMVPKLNKLGGGEV